MSIKVEEVFLQGKQSNSLLCEDSIYIDENFAAVVDGATSKSDFRFGGKTSGRIASELVVQAIAKLDRDVSAENAVVLINEEIYSFYERNGLVDIMKSDKLNRFNACAAIYSAYKREVWLIGDCQCIVNGENYNNEKKVDSVLSEVRALYLNMLLKDGASVPDLIRDDLGRAYIMPLLQKQNYFQNVDDKNNEYAYGLFDGFEFNSADIVKIAAVSREIILATDGYPKLLNTLESSEWYLKNVLSIDPLCMSLYKSTKGISGDNLSYDDRALVKIIVD